MVVNDTSLSTLSSARISRKSLALWETRALSKEGLSVQLRSGTDERLSQKKDCREAGKSWEGIQVCNLVLPSLPGCWRPLLEMKCERLWELEVQRCY